LCSCEQTEFRDAAASFVSLKNGDQISVDEYLQLKKYAADVGLTMYLQRQLKKEYRLNLSETEIRAVVYSEKLRVVLDKTKETKRTTTSKDR
jgi:hypothetical protein